MAGVFNLKTPTVAPLSCRQADRRTLAPKLELLRVYWRMVGPSARPVTCALYRTDAGFEVRAERSADDLIRSQLVPSEPAAQLYADAWRAALLAMGSFVDLDTTT